VRRDEQLPTPKSSSSGRCHRLRRGVRPRESRQDDILLVERTEDVGQVTTAQGAGCAARCATRPSASSWQCIRSRFSGAATLRGKPDWHEVGSFRIALSDKRVEEFSRLKRAAITPDWRRTSSAMRSQAPMAVDGFQSGQSRPLVSFRRMDDSTLRCKSYEHAARKLGVRFVTSTIVESIDLKNAGWRVCRRIGARPSANTSSMPPRSRLSHREARRVGVAHRACPSRVLHYGSMDDLAPDLPCFAFRS